MLPTGYYRTPLPRSRWQRFRDTFKYILVDWLLPVGVIAAFVALWVYAARELWPPCPKCDTDNHYAAIYCKQCGFKLRNTE